jgi:hypothetical protein
MNLEFEILKAESLSEVWTSRTELLLAVFLINDPYYISKKDNEYDLMTPAKLIASFIIN